MIHKLTQAFLIVALALIARAALADTSPLHNPHNPFDVDNNGFVVPHDFMLIADQLRSHGPSSLNGALLELEPQFLWDTSNDYRVTPRDALLVANHLAVTPEPSTVISAAVGLLALAGYCWRRRRKRS